MMYSACRDDVKTVIEWLQGSDKSQWEYQTILLSDTIAELQRMASPKRSRTGSRSVAPDVIPPGATEINTAMPHLMKMLSAMRSRNKPAAIESGEAALALLPEGP